MGAAPLAAAGKRVLLLSALALGASDSGKGAFASASGSGSASSSSSGSSQANGKEAVGASKIGANRYLLDRLEAVEAFLGRGGSRRCDLPRLDATGLTWTEVTQRLRGRPALLRGLVSETAGGRWGSDRNAAWTRKEFIEEFGGQYVKTNNGHFDHLRSKEVLTVAEFLANNASEWNLFLADHAYRLQADVSAALGPDTIPALMQGFDARPILSLGSKGSSTRSHRHAETWQLLLAGLKAWWISPGDLEKEISGGQPCAALRHEQARRGPRSEGDQKVPWLCVQHPGEAVYFGNNFPHATCNLEPFVLGLGAQGRTEGWIPLHRAAHQNDTATLQRIIEETGEVDAVDQEGSSALHRAAAMGHLAAVSLLVSAGANLRSKDREGKNAATMAAERGDLTLLRFLSDAGTPVKRKDGGRPHAVHWAALSGHKPILEFLVAQGASPHARDEKGTEPIHWAGMESNVQTVSFLAKELGANVSATGHGGEKPMHWAAGVGHASIIHFLLEERADPSAADARGTTALHFAAAQDRFEATERLLVGRADLGARASGGVQPIHAAASLGHARMIQVLLDARASPKSMDGAKQTPAKLAADAGHAAVLELLASRVRAEL
ncbi:unnamed protein product [Polarella glacialis]|uniref:JmjC domain-containing protein n=1 Tax=Polarella glacialis TaxID=89957 RepID=A0A813GV88_POLGL|nr:unnamed protein product [Polarella glacialis]